MGTGQAHAKLMNCDSYNFKDLNKQTDIKQKLAYAQDYTTCMKTGVRSYGGLTTQKKYDQHASQLKQVAAAILKGEAKGRGQVNMLRDIRGSFFGLTKIYGDVRKEHSKAVAKKIAKELAEQAKKPAPKPSVKPEKVTSGSIVEQSVPPANTMREQLLITPSITPSYNTSGPSKSVNEYIKDAKEMLEEAAIIRKNSGVIATAPLYQSTHGAKGSYEYAKWAKDITLAFHERFGTMEVVSMEGQADSGALNIAKGDDMHPYVIRYGDFKRFVITPDGLVKGMVIFYQGRTITYERPRDRQPGTIYFELRVNYEVGRPQIPYELNPRHFTKHTAQVAYEYWEQVAYSLQSSDMLTQNQSRVVIAKRSKVSNQEYAFEFTIYPPMKK